MAVDRQKFEFQLGPPPAVSPLASENLSVFIARMEVIVMPRVEPKMEWTGAK